MVLQPRRVSFREASGGRSTSHTEYKDNVNLLELKQRPTTPGRSQWFNPVGPVPVRAKCALPANGALQGHDLPRAY